MTLLFAVADLSEVGGGGVILIKSKASRAQILIAVLYQHTVTPAGALLVPLWRLGPLSIQPKSPEILVGTSNGTDHFGLVRPEYLGPALKVVHFDHSGLFGRPDRNVPFHLRKLLSPVPLFFVLLTRTITKQNLPFHWARGISKLSDPNFCWVESALRNLENYTLDTLEH